MKYFRSPLLIAVLALGALFWATHSLALVWQALTLAIIEVSMSFDNAVVNAEKLQDMNDFWRRMFFWIGIPIAVIGMRFFIPLEIVAVIEGSSIGQAYHLAVNDPGRFAESLTQAHAAIAGFGGAFLLLTALEFFASEEKEANWIPGENLLAKVGVVKGLEFVAVIVATLVAYRATGSMALVLASLGGVLTFVLMGALKNGMSAIDGKLASSTSALARLAAGGLGGFLYLEVLDASFSLDGVVAAFAISKSIFVVACGLGIGAAFVRALTVLMVDTKSSATFKFLPNGAFWSILALAVSMFISVSLEVPSWVIATLSVALIGGAFLASVAQNRKAQPQGVV